MTGLEPPPHEVVQAIAWAKSHVERAGFRVCDEVESEIGFVVALCWVSYSRRYHRHPFPLYASRAAYNRCLRLFVLRTAREEAYRLLGWQDVLVEDGAKLPVRRALRDLVAALPDELSRVAKAVWLRGQTKSQVSRDTGLTRRDVARTLERATIYVVSSREAS